MRRKALITGITGQDGSYLAELLLDKNYEVHGLVRRSSTLNRERLDPIISRYRKSGDDRIFLHYGDMIDSSSLYSIIKNVRPDEVYNLAAQSHVKVSFESPEYTLETNAVGVERMLEAIRLEYPEARFYQASTSEMFGKVVETPQTEKTPFYPRSPYGVSKVSAYWTVVNYRESYDIHASNGILFNHESPRRGENFVTKKITLGLVSYLKNGHILRLGNLDAKRDWGYAGDYVVAMWLMLQQEKPDDYVIATNETRSVREFIETGCKILDISIAWEGRGLSEKGIDKKTGKIIVEIDSNYFRPTEVDLLVGDYSKAKKRLGWVPKVSFEGLVRTMIEYDLERAEVSSIGKS